MAQVAMWLTDHQMNVEASEVFGEPILRIPLVKSAHIRHGNALHLDWAEFLPPTRYLTADINPYLADAPDVLIARRDQPLCAVPAIGIGNKPIDGGLYLFTPEERDDFIGREPGAARCFQGWIGADEFLNGYERWCLWLGDCPSAELRTMPEAKQRVEAVRTYRETSKSAPTRKLAATPTRFHVENMPGGDYLVIPEVSSERRRIIPIGYLGPKTLCSNLMKIVSGATLYDPDLMPPALVRAHQALDRAVDAADAKALGPKSKLNSDRERVAFLFALYQGLTSLIPTSPN